MSFLSETSVYQIDLGVMQHLSQRWESTNLMLLLCGSCLRDKHAPNPHSYCAAVSETCMHHTNTAVMQHSSEGQACTRSTWTLDWFLGRPLSIHQRPIVWETSMLKIIHLTVGLIFWSATQHSLFTFILEISMYQIDIAVVWHSFVKWAFTKLM